MNKFPKSERLRGKRNVEELFVDGKHFTLYPLKVLYLIKEQPAPPISNQMLVAVPKKIFRRAVDRNRIKRLIREAYRLNKPLISIPNQEFYLVIGYIYIGKEVPSYQYVDKKLKQSLLRLNKIIGH